jgi:hypothetical protein
MTVGYADMPRVLAIRTYIYTLLSGGTYTPGARLLCPSITSDVMSRFDVKKRMDPPTKQCIWMSGSGAHMLHLDPNVRCGTCCPILSVRGMNTTIVCGSWDM